MNSFAWPANVLKTEKGVVLAFPEWPDLAPVGDTVQEAMLAASEALSAAVSNRIEAGAKIPTPSDLGPRQIPIAIDGETAARVDAYLDEQEVKNFRQRTELEQANRERRATYLTDFHTTVDPIRRTRDRADSGAIEFALTAIRSCYLLNGGGLIAIPAIMKIFPDPSLPGSSLFWPAVIFVVGVFFCVATNFLAYRSMFVAGEGWAYEETARAQEVNGNYYPPEDQAAHKGQIAQHRIDREGKLDSARRHANIGLITFFGAIFCFLAGVSVAISIFS